MNVPLDYSRDPRSVYHGAVGDFIASVAAAVDFDLAHKWFNLGWEVHVFSCEIGNPILLLFCKVVPFSGEEGDEGIISCVAFDGGCPDVE